MSARRTRVSPRVRIRENDAHKDVLPPPADTGFVVGTRSPFNESRAIDFVTGTVVYPTMLYSGSSLADVGGILAEGRQTPGASDVHFNITVGTRDPFKEIVPAQTSSRLLFDDAQGSFSAPLGSRHAITIDITPSETKYVYRCPQKEIDQDTEGEFTKEGTGFCYFNFVTKRWDDIGVTDPITGGKSPSTDFACEFEEIEFTRAPSFYNTPNASGSNRYMGQFVPPNHINQRFYPSTSGTPQLKRFTDQMQIGAGTANIGQPTVSFFAPFATKYHATQSNVLKMSNYISAPFLLEKVRIEVPVVARRTHLLGTTGTPTSLYEEGRDLHLRDMDNYVFFLYRQARNANPLMFDRQSVLLSRDQQQDATASDRFLIASASACFYNSPTLTSSHIVFFQDTVGATPLSGTSAFISSSFPLHSPQFKHDFADRNLDPAGKPATYTSLFSGTLRLEMTPAISARGRKGATPLPFRTPSVNFPLNSAGVPGKLGNSLNYIQHIWPGSPSALSFGYNLKELGTYSGKSPVDIIDGFSYVYSASNSLSRAHVYSSWVGIDLYSPFLRDPLQMSVKFGSVATVIRSQMAHSTSLLSRPFSARKSFGPADMRNYDPRFFFGSQGPGDNQEIHAFAELAGGAFGTFFGTTSVNEGSARETPIILTPEDELVLGIDAGITPYEFITSAITGSFLKIESKRATITLYGSHVVGGERRQHQSDDQFGSHTVSQDITGFPVADEFLLDPFPMNYGNYHSLLATSSLGDDDIPSPLSRSFQYSNIEGTWGVDINVPRQERGRNIAGLPLSYEVDWLKYPRFVTLGDFGTVPIDASPVTFKSGSTITYVTGAGYNAIANRSRQDRRYVFRNDRFGQFANLLYTSPDTASKLTLKQIGNTTVNLGGLIETYPITTEITGATAYTQNASLHSTASFPYFDS